jgi:hypothetical protein
VAAALLDLPGTEFLDEAGRFLSQARAISPNHPRVVLAEFYYRFRRGEPKAYAQWLKEKGPYFASDARVLAGLEFQLGVLEARGGRCREAQAIFRAAESRDKRLAGVPRPFCG